MKITGEIPGKLGNQDDGGQQSADSCALIDLLMQALDHAAYNPELEAILLQALQHASRLADASR